MVPITKFYMETEVFKLITHRFQSGSFRSAKALPSPVFLGMPQHCLLAPCLSAVLAWDPVRGPGSSCSIKFTWLCHFSAAAEKWTLHASPAGALALGHRAGPLISPNSPIGWLQVSPRGRDLRWGTLGQESQNAPNTWGRVVPNSSCHFQIFPGYLWNESKCLSPGPQRGLWEPLKFWASPLHKRILRSGPWAPELCGAPN